MAHKQNGLVRVGEVIGDLPGPFQALHQNRTPQRGFTLADQVHQLVSASEADPDRGFMARMMVLCSLRHEVTPATAFNTSASTGRSRST